jgi:hypothetical protein
MKNNHFLKYLLILIISISTSSLFGQISETENSEEWKNFLFTNIKKSTYINSWQLAISKDGVNIYYKYSDCSDIQNDFHPDNVLLKVENTNNYKAYAVWEYATVYNNVKSRKKETDENVVQVFLDPNTSEEASCSSNQKLKVFVKLKNSKSKQALTDINLDNLRIFKI